MSIPEIILAVLGLVVAGFTTILWHNFRKVESMAEKTKDDLASHKLDASKEYATKDQLSEAIVSFVKSLDAVFHKLEVMQLEIKEMSNNFRDRLDKKQDKE